MAAHSPQADSQRFQSGDTEHEMRDAKLSELLKLSRYLGSITSDIVFLTMALYFGGIFRNTDRTEVSEFNFSGIASDASTMLFEDRELVGILLNRTGIEVPPIGIASDQSQGALFTPATNQQRNRRGGQWSAPGTLDVVMVSGERSGLSRPQRANDLDSIFQLLHARF